MYTIPIDFHLDSNAAKAITAIFCTLIGFSTFWFLSKSAAIKAWFFKKYAHDLACRKHIFFTKYMGFLWMGILPLLTMLCLFPDDSLGYFGLNGRKDTLLFSLVWTLGLSILVIPMAYFSAKKPKNLVNYPQIRAKNWDRKTFYINLLGWAIYLFGYELLFRGVLLFPLAETLGIWPAIAINIALYAATHIPKGLDETIGAAPLGLVLCILTLQSGNIWIAFLVHVALAWTNSLTALRYHPDIHYTHWKK
jgi:membrane protease YdiL (CAAX protease family)